MRRSSSKERERRQDRPTSWQRKEIHTRTSCFCRSVRELNAIIVEDRTTSNSLDDAVWSSLSPAGEVLLISQCKQVNVQKINHLASANSCRKIKSSGFNMLHSFTRHYLERFKWANHVQAERFPKTKTKKKENENETKSQCQDKKLNDFCVM